ncbi:aminopeptidase [bacterium]|nr:aminopeptidase [bacterium]MDY2885641.1 aminopeptidase [Bariatricus sp.]MCI7149108.1 aminopeptidase [bacterium]MDD6515445.1 aminopeptidase [bacterium]MDY4194738.1 aminopeptidase [Bariatricus sp.]
MKITEENTVKEPYQSYFRHVAEFLLRIHDIKDSRHTSARASMTKERLEEEMQMLYYDVLPQNYETSYANPEYAVRELGEELGAFLSALYTELRGDIGYVYEERYDYIVIGNELFIEIYNKFEEEETPSPESLKEIFYWYASDYCDVYAADRVVEQIDPEAYDFAVKRIMESDLTDLRYLYRFGEYVSENELKTAEYLNSLPQETIDKMADTYTEGFRVGFINTGKDLSKKSVVNIRYVLGFERVVRKAIQNFEKMGLKPTIYRAASSVITRPRLGKNGFYGGIPNKQYDYDHKDDLGLVLDKQFMERKLEVMRTVLEKNKELAGSFAGPAVMEVFGEKPFAPVTKPEAVTFSKKQEELLLIMNSRAGQITNQYIKGEERSFTIISWPLPEIGNNYPEIFDEVIRINTLDANVYEKVQQTLIDALDQGEYVRILGKGANKTDLKVSLCRLKNPEKETIFENCVADVNIPVGEVFTSPMLEGTEGVLYVSKVYLNELQYRDLEIHFKEGKTTEYTCSNFESEEENKKYICDNIMHNHESLPLGEFAIGTNTTAYMAAKKYDIADKLPILIAEKMGPHFAVGDTCYSWAEDNVVYNPNGKEIIAKENSVSACRKENPEQAYFQCHTDITIPYEELGKISVFTCEGKEIVLIENGRFTLPGTEILNEPLDK